LQDAHRLEDWKDYGGLQALMFYGVAPSIQPSREDQNELVRALRKDMPDPDRQFFGELRTSFVCRDFFFANAGVQPGVPLRQHAKKDFALDPR
jgi:serine/threonine protein phosphatase 1